VEPIRFTGQIRFWNPERASGLAVVDIPAADVEALGGLKQQRVHGRIGAVDFTREPAPAISSVRFAPSTSTARSALS
jgi:Domain of unknown function (DUF1905)